MTSIACFLVGECLFVIYYRLCSFIQERSRPEMIRERSAMNAPLNRRRVDNSRERGSFDFCQRVRSSLPLDPPESYPDNDRQSPFALAG